MIIYLIKYLTSRFLKTIKQKRCLDLILYNLIFIIVLNLELYCFLYIYKSRKLFHL